jgi:hypothetical protein
MPDDSRRRDRADPARDFIDETADFLDFSSGAPPDQVWCRCTAEDHPNHPDGPCAAAASDDGFCLDCFGFVHRSG